MGHEHHHHGGGRAGREGQRRSLAITLALAASYMLAELIGGLLTGSLALLADAGHMLADTGALALSLFAIWLAARPAPPEHTYGFHRTEILAALANGAVLIAVAFGVVLEAVERLGNPTPVLGGPMMVVATGGLVVNGIGLWLLHAGKDENLNVRGAWLHVLSDALGSVGAVAAGALIVAFGWYLADPIASMLIAALIVRASWALLRETVGVLMEGAPPHIDVDEVREAIRTAPGVLSVHDLHVWTITSGMVALSCHVQTAETTPTRELLARLQELLKARFDIHHATLQIEPEGYEHGDRDVC